jgi:hypothetical protein
VNKVASGHRKTIKGFRFEYCNPPDLPGEEWKRHPHLDMELSSKGRYRSKKIYASFGSLSYDGYMNCLFQKKTYKVHRLVAETFIGIPEDTDMEVDHSPQAMPLSGWPKVAPERIHEGREYWPRRHTFGFFWQERCTPMRWT